MIVVCASESPLDEIAKAEFVSQIPADTEDNDLPIEVAPFEEFVHAQHAKSASPRVTRLRNMLGF